MISTNTTYCITDDNPIALTADWLLLLLRHGGAEHLDRPFDQHNSYRDLAARIAALRPEPTTPAIEDVLASGIMPAHLLDIGYLARRLWIEGRPNTGLPSVGQAGRPNTGLPSVGQEGAIDDHCPEFPWFQVSPSPYPSTIEAFDLPWRLREELRLATGRYSAVPWASELPPIPDHFVHISLATEGLVAYTASAEKGEKDIQTVIKPARYLKRFYPDLTDHAARDLGERVEKPAKLHFATTTEAIVEIYVTGPSSCMSKPAHDYDSHCHPVSVYGGSDLALAYITGSDGTPSARCLVWPDKQIHGRIYGHESRMLKALEREGWERGSFSGACIRRIPDEANSDSLVMPYLDGVQSFDVDDDDWVNISRDGAFEATSTTGLTRITGFTICTHCDSQVDDDDIYTVDGEDWCDNCRDNHAFCSGFSEEYFHEDDRVEVVTERRPSGALIETPWARCEADEHAFYCEGSGRYYHDRRFDVVMLKNGEAWEAEYFYEHGDPDDLVRDDHAAAETLVVKPQALDAQAGAA